VGDEFGVKEGDKDGKVDDWGTVVGEPLRTDEGLNEGEDDGSLLGDLLGAEEELNEGVTRV
jgi:hypothetical protein